jgi:hypothetical protein
MVIRYSEKCRSRIPNPLQPTGVCGHRTALMGRCATCTKSASSGPRRPTRGRIPAASSPALQHHQMPNAPSPAIGSPRQNGSYRANGSTPRGARGLRMAGRGIGGRRRPNKAHKRGGRDANSSKPRHSSNSRSTAPHRRPPRAVRGRVRMATCLPWRVRHEACVANLRTRWSRSRSR